MNVCCDRVSSLYIMTLQVLVDWNNFELLHLNDLPGIIKEDLLVMALRRGKAKKLVSNFLHPKIRELHINESKLSCTDLNNISSCSEIRVLEMNPPILQRFDHPVPVLKHLFSSLPSLKKLHIQRNDGVTDDVIKVLATHCRTLRELDVSGCINLSDKSAAHFSQFPSLRALNISQTLLGDDVLSALAAGSCSLSLVELTFNSCPKVSSTGLKLLLTHCTNLAILICSGCPSISGHKTVRTLAAQGWIGELLCCQLAPPELIQCHHHGNCILKLRSGLLLIL